MANLPALNLSGIKEAVGSQTAFQKLLAAISAQRGAKEPEPTDANLKLKDVRTPLAILTLLQSLAPGGSGIGATSRFLESAQARKTQNTQRKDQINRQIFESQQKDRAINLDVAQAEYGRAEGLRKEGIETARYRQTQRDKAEIQEEIQATKREQIRTQNAERLSRQYSDAVRFGKSGNIRRAAEALQNLPDEFKHLAPTPEQVEADIDEAKQNNRFKAIQLWDSDLSKKINAYGYVDPKDVPALLRRSFALAKQFEIQDPDIFSPIPTAKTIGLKNIEEKVRANLATEKERNRHNVALEGQARNRIAQEAERIEIARGHLNVARANAGTYRGKVEADLAKAGAIGVAQNAEKKIRELDGKVARYSAIKKPNAQETSLLQQYEAERDYWQAIKTQAGLTQTEIDEINRFTQGAFGGMAPTLGVRPVTPNPDFSGPIDPGGGKFHYEFKNGKMVKVPG